MSNVFYKAPGATLDYVIDYTSYLDGDTLATSVWSTPDGITLSNATNTTTSARAFLSGGAVDTDYILTNTITTSGGRTDVRTLMARVRSPSLLAAIAQLRRMVAEPTEATYDNGALEELIASYKLPDRRGENPDYLRVWPLNSRPIYAANPDWAGAYDLNAAAAQIWQEKAAGIAACSFDFRTDAGSFSKSQKYAAYMRMASMYRARRTVKPLRLTPENRIEDREGYIINDEGL